MRVAILSTPRSGNTWLRHLLMKAYDAVGIVVFSPTEVDWSNLPQSCVLQIHWRRLPLFVQRLEYHGFRIVALARHPLDVLISILHFSLHHSTARWLEGEGGNESSILGAMPGSALFQEYATGPRAAALLDVTRQWWNAPGSYRIHFEDLVADPRRQVEELVGHLGWEPSNRLEAAIEDTRLDKLRSLTQAPHHFWQGKPGLWRRLFTAAEAEAIRCAHEGLFADLGYDCDPDLELGGAQADANWIQLTWSDLADGLQNHHIAQHTIRQLETRLQAAEDEALHLRTQLAAMRSRLENYERPLQELDELKNRLLQAGMTWAELNSLGPASLGLAGKLQNFSRRLPALAAMIKKVRRLGRPASVHSR